MEMAPLRKLLAELALALLAVESAPIWLPWRNLVQDGWDTVEVPCVAGASSSR